MPTSEDSPADNSKNQEDQEAAEDTERDASEQQGETAPLPKRLLARAERQKQQGETLPPSESSQESEPRAKEDAPDEPIEPALPPTEEAIPAEPAIPPTEERMLSRRQIREQESGIGVWLSLAIGAGGMLLMLLLPWVNVYYLNPMQTLFLGGDGSIVLTKDEVVHVSLSGLQLLTLTLWPLLALFLLTALLLGVAIYWRRTRFMQVRIAWLVLVLGLIVGIGFPVALQQLWASSHRVEWSNIQATIEQNSSKLVFANDERLGLCTPKGQNDHSCDKYYAQGVILFAVIDWKQIVSERRPSVLVQGHASGLRASATSPNVTTSGYADGSFGAMGTSIGYWGGWLFSLWILVSALILLRRLIRSRL